MSRLFKFQARGVRCSICNIQCIPGGLALLFTKSDIGVNIRMKNKTLQYPHKLISCYLIFSLLCRMLSTLFIPLDMLLSILRFTVSDNLFSIFKLFVLRILKTCLQCCISQNTNDDNKTVGSDQKREKILQ